MSRTPGSAKETFRAATVLLLLSTSAGIGCGSGAPADVADNGFVALTGSFVGFRAWPSKTIISPSAEGAGHVAGARTTYINRLPPSDATVFPVGTVIVKVTEDDGKIFARTKRGNDFNDTGAVGWEWFELQDAANNGIHINWRGLGPPLGEVYGGDPNSSCNSCHKVGAANDYVLSDWLTLGQLGRDSGGPGPVTGDGGTTEDDAGPPPN